MPGVQLQRVVLMATVAFRARHNFLPVEPCTVLTVSAHSQCSRSVLTVSDFVELCFLCSGRFCLGNVRLLL